MVSDLKLPSAGVLRSCARGVVPATLSDFAKVCRAEVCGAQRCSDVLREGAPAGRFGVREGGSVARGRGLSLPAFFFFFLR